MDKQHTNPMTYKQLCQLLNRNPAFASGAYEAFWTRLVEPLLARFKNAEQRGNSPVAIGLGYFPIDFGSYPYQRSLRDAWTTATANHMVQTPDCLLTRTPLYKSFAYRKVDGVERLATGQWVLSHETFDASQYVELQVGYLNEDSDWRKVAEAETAKGHRLEYFDPNWMAFSKRGMVQGVRCITDMILAHKTPDPTEDPEIKVHQYSCDQILDRFESLPTAMPGDQPPGLMNVRDYFTRLGWVK